MIPFIVANPGLLSARATSAAQQAEALNPCARGRGPRDMSTITDRLKRMVAGEQGGPVQATWNGAVIARSERTVRLEGNHYFPLQDVNAEHLQRCDRQSVCPWKGTASYYDVVVDGQRNAAAAWYYPDPKPAARQIAGHVAFWRGVKVGRVPAA